MISYQHHNYIIATISLVGWEWEVGGQPPFQKEWIKLFVFSLFGPELLGHCGPKAREDFFKVHAKGVVLSERACFCLLSAFYDTTPF